MQEPSGEVHHFPQFHPNAVTCVEDNACDGSEQVNGDQSIVPLPQFHDREQNQLPIFP